MVEPKIINWIQSAYSPQFLGKSVMDETRVVHSEIADERPSSSEGGDTPVWEKSRALMRLANNQVLFDKICEMFIESVFSIIYFYYAVVFVVVFDKWR